MKKLLLILLCLPFIGFGQTDFHKEYYENGQLKAEGEIVYSSSDGLWKYYYENGQLKAEGNWSLGKRDGLWKLWYENGQLKLVSNWIYNGNEYLHGFYKAYNMDGQVTSDGNYKFNEENGWWKIYNENGQLIQEGIYESGHKTGWWKYYIDGKIDSEKKFEPNNRLRGWRFFFSNGQLKEQQDWFNDVKTQKLQIYKQCWNEKGMATECIDSSVVDKFGDTIIIYELPELVFGRFYMETGEMRAEGAYNREMAEKAKQDYIRLHDSVLVWYEEKKTYLKEKRDWEKIDFFSQYDKYSVFNNFAVGIWKEYHKNGQLSSQGNYKDFKHDGLWRTYHDNGQLRSEELYKDGELISETWWDKNGEREYY